MARLGSQRHAGRHGVASREDAGIGDAAQMCVHLDAALADAHTSLFQIQAVEVGHPPGGMNHQIGVEPEMPPLLIRVNPEAGAYPLDRRHGRGRADIDRQVVGALDQQVHQIGVEPAQQALPALKHGDFGRGADGEVGELHRDVAAADQNDAARQNVEVEEIFARRHQFGPFDRQRGRFRSGGDHEVIRLQQFVPHRQGITADEPGGAMQRHDASVGE